MSQQPSLSAAALRGAVDLSGLGQRPATSANPMGPGGGGASGAAAQSGQGGKGGQGAAGQAGGSAASRRGVLREVYDDTLEQLLDSTRSVAALAVIWSSAHAETAAAVEVAVQLAHSAGGALQVLSIDIQQARQVAAAFGVQQVPVTLGIIAGQPVPLFGGVQDASQLQPVVDQLLQVAQQNGVTGRIALTDDEGGVAGSAEAAAGPQLPPHLVAAYDAIDAGDLDGAVEAFTTAVAQNPGDEEASTGLAQATLLRRTTGVDHIAARRAAADDPSNVDAAILVADLDLLGGHLDDSFGRLIDLVRTTAGDEREKVRTHLLELFAIAGAHDERVVKARRALMSALF